MALLEMDGFDYEPSSNQVFNALAAGALPTKTDGTFFPWVNTGNSAQGTKSTPLSATGAAVTFNTNNSFILCSPGANYATLIGGFRYFYNTGFNDAVLVCSYLDSGSTQVGIAINSARQCFFYRGTTATVLQTGTKVLVHGATYMFELKVTFGAVGSYDFRIDSVTELSSGAANTSATGNAFASTIRLDGGASLSTKMDDFYLLDNTGPAPLNDFLSIGGAVRIETVFITTDNAVAFTPLSGTNASNVDEVANDGDTTYNFSSTPGQADTFNHAALNSVPVTIYAVQVIASMRKDDVTPQTARTKMISGAVTSNGASTALETVYVQLFSNYTTDPNTGVAWIAANADATKIGYEHV